MGILQPHIDPVLFECRFEEFRAFIENKSNTSFDSFSSNPYTKNEEGFKSRLQVDGQAALSPHLWKQSDIGTGTIVRGVISAIELPQNKLVRWQGKYGPQSRPHRQLHEILEKGADLPSIEECFFGFYRGNLEDSLAFSHLSAFFGKTYPLLAYLFFLKDPTSYLPIAPTYFDQAFHDLGAGLKTSKRCSWENYQTFLNLFFELKILLSGRIGPAVSLLDAHSFAWILACQMERTPDTEVQWYQKLSISEREAIVKARIGQGKFRQSLIDYWGKCSVTGCSEIRLLRASHIKPWVVSSLTERFIHFNGLLLSPGLDACFDGGYISFDDTGKILVSSRLCPEDYVHLGLHPDLYLHRVEKEHQVFLAYHREHIFK